MLQVLTWRPSVPRQGPHSILKNSQVAPRSPVPSGPGTQGPESTQLTLQPHGPESIRGSPRSQSSPCSGPLSLSLMPGRGFPSSVRLHSCSPGCDALPCFPPGDRLRLSSVSPPHLDLLRPLSPGQRPPPPPPQPRQGRDCHMCLSVAWPPSWRKALSGQGLGLPVYSVPGTQEPHKVHRISTFVLLSSLTRRICPSTSWVVKKISL